MCTTQTTGRWAEIWLSTKVRWNLGIFFACLCAGNRNERRQGGGDTQMKISIIEALVPAASANKSN